MSQDNTNNKAQFWIYDKEGIPDKTNKTPIMFNPSKYSVRKSNKFASHSIPGTNAPHIQFISGEAETLSVELFFDTYNSQNKEHENVKTEYIDKISNLLNIDLGLHAPPVCGFFWGGDSFKGVVESMDTNYTMFDEGGMPLRATVTLTLKQYSNPHLKLESTDRTKSRIVKEGDSLWKIASDEYDDPSKWKIIANKNDIEDPKSLKPGTRLIIPPI